MEEELEKNIQQEQEDFKNKYLYLLADFQNYKKQTEKRISSIQQNKHKDLIIKLLEVLDNCERSFEYDKEYKPIYDLLINILQADGLESIDVQIGDLFDETYMNAVMAIDDDVFESKQITKVIRKGYSYKGEIIRFTDVIVNN